MTRRILILLGVCILFAVGGLSALWLDDPSHCINEDDFARIENGMTKQEVIDILGEPHECHYGEDMVAMFPDVSPACIMEWRTEGAVFG
jgi:SmpA / OmlA family